MLVTTISMMIGKIGSIN